LNVVEHPEIREAVAKKDEQLAGFLKGMIVNPERMGEVRKKTARMFLFIVHHVYVEKTKMSKFILSDSCKY